MPDRLRPADHRFLAVCALLLAVTVWFSARYFYRAFPEASIDFRVTRDQAGALAERFLSAQGKRVADYRRAARFSYDDTAKTFLERELGLQQANRLMGSHVRLWHWSWRWFRPLQKEEFRVDVTPAGETVGFEHQIPEAAARPSLPAAGARAMAERFLRDTMRRDPAGLDFVEDSSSIRPARTDHTFTWKERGFSIHDATYRVEVTISGDQVGGYREYLKVPETWSRAYESLRSRNLTAQYIDSGFMMLLTIGLLVVLLMRVRNRDVRWRRAATVGAMGGALYFLAGWNAHPLAEFNYPTTDPYAVSVFQEFLRNLTSALAAAGLLFVLTAGAEPLYRQAYGARLSVGSLFRPRALRTRQFFLGVTLGVALAGVFVAYQTAFYMIAYRFGAWSPADVPYDDLLNTRLPWLFVLFGGFLPAVSEEFLFRMFAIPFLAKLLRWLPVAIVLAGFIWGFGHAGYPQQPYWIRGVEVGIGGVALGLIMLRWGILPTLVWHYSVDALYTALLLVRSHNAYFLISGAASAGIMVLPVLIAGFAYLRHGGFAPETGLTNADETKAEPPPTALESAPPSGQPPGLPAPPWPPVRVAAALLVAIAAAAVIAAVHPLQFGDAPRFAIAPTRAREIAATFARTQGFEPRGYRSVVSAVAKEDSDTRLAAKYMVERRDISYVADAFRRWSPLHGWSVRFFKPLQREEMQVAIDPETGRVLEFNHTLPEDQPGADLSPDAARQVAADFLAARGFDLRQLALKNTSDEKKKARRDHSLVWEAKPGDPRNVDEAHFRVSVEVAGDRVVSLSPSWKLPEAFERARSRRNALSNVLLVLRVLVFASLLVAGIWLLIRHTRDRTLRWRQALWIALPVGGVSLIGMSLNFPLLFALYPTTFPLESFEAVMIVGLVIGALALLVALACAAALILALRPDALAVFRAGNRRRLCGGAIATAVIAALIGIALDRLQWAAIARFHPQALLSVSARSWFATAAPAGSALSAACQEILFWLVLLVLIVHIVRYLERWPGTAIVAAVVAAAALVPSTTHTSGEFLFYYCTELIYFAAAWAIIRFFARGNHLAYVLTAWTLAVLGKAAALFAQPAGYLRLQGGLLIAVLLASLVWAAAPGARRESALPFE